MFPAGYYYGGPLNEQIGPKNAIIPQAEIDLHPTATLGITLKALFVWREDTADGLYDTPGFLILPGSVNSQRHVGASPQVLITQQLGRHLTVSLNYYHFYRGGPDELLGRSVFGSGGNLGFGRDGSHAEYVAVPVTRTPYAKSSGFCICNSAQDKTGQAKTKSETKTPSPKWPNWSMTSICSWGPSRLN